MKPRTSTNILPARLARWALIASVLVLQACQQDDGLPIYVSGPISGLVLGCTEAGEAKPAASVYVTRADIDGDGKPDFIVDTAKGCKANKLLYCSDEGCVANAYLTTWESTASPSFRTLSFSTVARNGRTEIDVRYGGPGCATQPGGSCQRSLAFDGSDLKIVAGK